MTVHVYPENDWIEHDVDSSASECQCLCEPTVKWLDEETGEPLARPLVIHNAVDGRESPAGN